jgi:hypothetical protein
MVNLEQIQLDVSNLPEEAQMLVTDLIESLKQRYSVGEKQEAKSEETLYDKFEASGLIGFCSVEEDLSTTSDINMNNKAEDWADFIGCMEAESDLSENYKTYLKQKLDEKYNNH